MSRTSTRPETIEAGEVFNCGKLPVVMGDDANMLWASPVNKARKGSPRHLAKELSSALADSTSTAFVPNFTKPDFIQRHVRLLHSTTASPKLEAPENAEDDVATLSPPKNIMKMRIASPPKALSPPLQDEERVRRERANLRESPDCGRKTSAALKAKQRRKLYTRASMIDAATHGDLETVKEAIRAGVGINSIDPDFYGETALHRASIAGHLHIVDWLVSCGGAQCDVRSHDGKTPLDVAEEFQQRHIVNYLRGVTRWQLQTPSSTTETRQKAKEGKIGLGYLISRSDKNLE
eukprot:g3720.t1